MNKIRAIIKRPDEKHGHVTYISNTLKNLQSTVGGPIEVVRITEKIAIICNEEGKIRNLDKNFTVGRMPFIDIISGPAIVVGVDGEEFGDLGLSFEAWKNLLKVWGNV